MAVGKRDSNTVFFILGPNQSNSGKIWVPQHDSNTVFRWRLVHSIVPRQSSFAIWPHRCNHRKYSCIRFHKKNRWLGIFFVSQIFEILIRDGAIFPLKLIRNSNVIRMLTFMGVSAFILDTVHVMGGHVFWLIQPFRQPATPLTNNNEEEKDQEICLHKNSTCESYVWQALKNYSSIGICLEVIKALYSNFGLICRSPAVGLRQSVKRINPRFLMFVAGYPTLYRVCRFVYFECHAKCF